jgi:polysaccharide biosynthesis/export protein
MIRGLRFILALGLLGPLLASVSGCANLPSSGPTSKQVVKPSAKPSASGTNTVEVRDVTQVLVETMPPPALAENSAWSIGNAPPVGDIIAVGDRVSITIFEMGYGLFTPGSPSGTSPASADNSTAPRSAGRNFPAILITESGVISLPYIGRVRAAGSSANAMTQEIERRLRGKSQFAQALVTVERGASRSIFISGDVKQPGRQVLTPSGERLLDAIAMAGGPQGRVADTVVRLSRDGISSDIRMEALGPNGPENVRLGTGDRIELVRNVRSFSILGAAKTVAEIPFDTPKLTLIEALSRAGGPIDDKGDATGVFVFRYEKHDGDSGGLGKPVIYRLNLLNPQSYFAAQRFYMQEKDVMLIANARTSQLNKVVQLLNAVTSPVVTLDILTR